MRTETALYVLLTCIAVIAPLVSYSGVSLIYPNSTSSASVTTPKVVLDYGNIGASLISIDKTGANVSQIVGGFSETSKSNAFIAYRSATGTFPDAAPKERDWGGSSWSDENEMPTAGQTITWVRSAYCPVAQRYYEKIVVTLSSDSYLDAYVWTGGGWSVTNNIARVGTAGTGYQSFDVAYESSSGRAVLVYAVYATSSQATRDLAYKIWNGTAWSGELYIDDPGHTTSKENYRWVELASNPKSGSNEIALIGVDFTTRDCNGWIWDGNQWGNFLELREVLTSGVLSNKPISVEYEQISGKAMFIWGYSGYLESREWNGTSWEASLPSISISTTANVLWAILKRDPTSNYIMAVTIDGGADLNTILWDGTVWNAPVEHDASITTSSSRCADFDWEPSGSKGLLAWSTSSDSISYKTLGAPSTWSSTSTVSNPAGHPWIQLRRNPRNVSGDSKILGATLNGNQDIFGLTWDGNSLMISTTALTTDTSVTGNECFDAAISPLNPIIEHDYVLKIVNQVNFPWKIRLRAVSENNISLIKDCRIRFHNGGSADQIKIFQGSYSSQVGSWYDLASLGTVYVAVWALTTNTGHSQIYTGLDIQIPSTGVTTTYKIAFDIE